LQQDTSKVDTIKNVSLPIVPSAKLPNNFVKGVVAVESVQLMLGEPIVITVEELKKEQPVKMGKMRVED
jgi:hypothetical protein